MGVLVVGGGCRARLSCGGLSCGVTWADALDSLCVAGVRQAAGWGRGCCSVVAASGCRRPPGAGGRREGRLSRRPGPGGWWPGGGWWSAAGWGCNAVLRWGATRGRVAGLTRCYVAGSGGGWACCTSCCTRAAPVGRPRRAARVARCRARAAGGPGRRPGRPPGRPAGVGRGRPARARPGGVPPAAGAACCWALAARPGRRPGRPGPWGARPSRGPSWPPSWLGVRFGVATPGIAPLMPGGISSASWNGRAPCRWRGR